MKIGIFSGTFDPFSCAHLAIAKKAVDSGLVDRVIIVPTTVNYYRPDKRYLFTFDEKVQIITTFICGEPQLSIDPIEKDKDSKWRTVNTMEHFRETYPDDDIFLIVGEDSYDSFDTWFRYDDILRLCKLIVVNRGESEDKDFLKFGEDTRVLTLKGYENVSATKVRSKLIEELLDMYLSDKEFYCS